MKCSFVTGAIAVTCLFASGTAAWGQTPGSDRPYRALFGRGSSGNGGQSLDLSTTVIQAYDDNLLAEVGTVGPGAATLSGYYTMLQSAGAFAWATPRVQLGITGASAFRYYGQVGEFQSVSHSAGVGLSATLPKRTGLALNQSAAYSPSYLSGLFPSLNEPRLGDALPSSPNYNIDDVTSYAYATTAALTHGLTRRGSVRAVVDYTFTDFSGQSTARTDGSSYGATAGVSRDLGRHSGVSLDYRFRTGDFGFAGEGKSTEHGVNFGLRHTRVLSATRTAQFEFGIGGSGSTVPPRLISATPSASAMVPERLYRVTGNGAIAYQFSRTGEVRASFRRAVEYIVQLGQPVLIDGLSASLAGSPTRRLQLTIGAGYSSGASALQATAKFDTYTATVRSHVSITSMLAGYAEYLYYFYDFGADPLLAPNVPRRLERNGVRVGLTLSTPLLRR